MNLETFTGECIELHTTALEKTILAYLPDERVDAIIEQHGLRAKTPDTTTDYETLEEGLVEIRDQEAAVSRGERIRGCCIVAPILNDD